MTCTKARPVSSEPNDANVLCFVMLLFAFPNFVVATVAFDKTTTTTLAISSYRRSSLRNSSHPEVYTMKFLIILSLISQIMGFLVSRRSSNTITLSPRRSILLQSTSNNESPQWVIDGGDTSETECSSSGDIIRAAATAKAAAEAATILAAENEVKANEEKKRIATMEVAAANAAKEAKAVVVEPTKAVAAVASATVEAPKVDLTKLSVGTDSFDVGLLIAFPIIVATLGFFFLFPLIGPQLAATLPPVPKM